MTGHGSQAGMRGGHLQSDLEPGAARAAPACQPPVPVLRQTISARIGRTGSQLKRGRPEPETRPVDSPFPEVT